MPDEIDRVSEQWFFLQLAAIIRARIERGEYEPGTLLPREPHFMQHYGVSRGTVRKAAEELARSGHIRRIKGRGNLVLPPQDWH